MIFISETNKRIHSRKVGIYQCQCGEICERIICHVNSGKIKSCGCLKHTRTPIKFQDLTNQKFNMLTVIKKTKYKGCVPTAMYWECRCDCGNTVLVNTYSLHKGIKKSCGCAKKTAWNSKMVGELGGLFWRHIVNSAKSRNIEIKISQQDAWDQFKKQNGKCAYTGLQLIFPPNWKEQSKKTASLDRIDNNLGYIIGNIQWVHKNVNLMKRTMSEKEFIEFCFLVTNYYKGDSNAY